MTQLRIAFITPEFVTEYDTGGGLGNYLNRMTRALVEAGHRPEVFVPSAREPGTIDFDGVLVHRVRRTECRLWARFMLTIFRWLRLRRIAAAFLLVTDALALANALRVAERERPYAFVQSADFQAAGLFVASSPTRRHIVRCSSDGELWARANHDSRPGREFEADMQLAAVRGADAAYAPSEFLANHMVREHGIATHIVRPPVFVECGPEKDETLELPRRYLIHFGQLAGAKGTPVIAEALPLVWEQAPDFCMVWAGPDYQDRFPAWARSWGERRSQIQWLGEVRKPLLYDLLLGAEAAVLPSVVDNLPNTVIESLLLGIPVIGSAGASIDELVEPGLSGELVPIGDVEALANVMINVWRGDSPLCRGFRWSPPVARELAPDVAVDSLLRFAGVAEIE